MITYRDMTFCGYFKDCLTGKVCRRALTKENESKALQSSLPICRFIEKPDCFEKK
jgi:hypothetical protein